MRSTSSDGVVARDLPASSLRAAGRPADLRTGTWTRLGSSGVTGDAATEAILGGLAERSHQAARAQGYATGWAEGRRVGLARAEEEAAVVRREAETDRARRDAEHRQALVALEAAVAELRARTSEAVDAVAAQAVEVALELARAVVGREVATATDPGADALRRAMSQVAPNVAVTVRLNPEDRAALDRAALDASGLAVPGPDRAALDATGLPGGLAGGHVVLVDDPSLARGDAVAETEDSLVDATISAALDRVREVLTR